MSDLFVAYDPAKEPGDRLAPEVVDEIQIIAQAGVDSVIGSADLEDGAVTTAKIADGAVTAPKLASGAVTTAAIANGSINTDKLGPAAVTTAKVAAGIVTSHDKDDNVIKMDVVPLTAEEYAAIPEKDPNVLYLLTDGDSSVEVPGGGGSGGGTVGPQGPAGPAGAAATIAVGSTTTGAAGSSAAVTNSGSSSAAVFDFVIPRGEKGADGQQGIQGAPGLGIRFKGEVQSLAELNAITGQVQGDLWVIGNRDDDSQPAESYIWDEAQADWLYGGRIQGPQGVPGKDGADSTVPGPAGSDGAPGADGAPGSPGEKGDRGDPGDTGAAATIAVGTTTTGAAGAAASVSNTGTSSAAVFDFVIPAGVAGADGAPGADGADGAPGPTAVSADADNASTLGSDGLIYTPIGGGAVGPQGPPGVDGQDGADGAPGPTAVSADADNASVLGTDGLIYTPSLLDAGGQLPESALPDGVELQANKGVNNGYASLDAAGKLPSSQLPLSALEYKGTWDAAANIPPLVDGVGTPGDMWRVTVTGTQFGVKFTAGDFALFNGTKWETATSGTAGVSTVAGLTGDVAAVPLKAALELDLVDNTADATKSVLSASKLTTPRLINGVAFDGTADVTVEDDTKEPVIAPGTESQYLRGDKTWQELPAAGGGLVTAPSVADFPAAGESGKVYLAEDTGDAYRFDATAKAGTDTYVRIAENTVAAKIEDSTEIGRDLVTAVDEVSGRAAIAATDVRIDGVNVSAVEVDVTPLTAHDVGAYTFDEVDDAIEAAKNRPALIAPAVDQINDVNTKPVLVFPAAVNAVNYLQLSNAASGGGVNLMAQGSDANVNASVFSKGTGEVALRGGTNNARIISASPVSIGANFLTIANSAVGNSPSITTVGSDAKIDLTILTKGSGSGVRIAGQISAQNFIPTPASVVTSNGLYPFSAITSQVMVFTGTANHRVGLPTTSVTVGMQWRVVNNSTGILTVELPSAAVVTTIGPGESRLFVAQVDTPTTAAHWGGLDGVKGSVAGTPTTLTLWTGTKSQYDSIVTKSQTTVYVVTAVTAVTGDITSTEGL